MRYKCQLIDDKPRERPIVMYTDSWAEVKRWAKLILEREMASRVDIIEYQPVLRKSYTIEDFETKEKKSANQI